MSDSSASSQRELVVLVTRGTDHELSSVAFTVACGGITSGMKVYAFLVSSGVDLVRRKASRSGQRLDLTAKEFTLLTLLLRRQGQVLSRTALAAQVWDMNFDSNTNVVEVAVRRLRGKIDDAFEKKLLHTVRGMGYVLEDRKP